MTVASHMPTAVASSAVRAGPNVRQLSALQLITLGLTPGQVGALVYVALAAVAIGAGYPPVAALFVRSKGRPARVKAERGADSDLRGSVSV